MRILAITNVGFSKKESAVQIWRVWRPLEELKKHVDWTIDYQPTFIKDIDKYKNLAEFTDEEIEKAGEHLGTYDIVFSSYHADAGAFSLMMAVSNRYGTKFILDDDDNSFAIDATNPVWLTLKEDDVHKMQIIARNAPYICTTTKSLAKVFQDRTEVAAKVFVIPNYIPYSYQSQTPDNGEKLIIGYFGGAAHWIDLDTTGVLPALQKIMHEYKNVHFHSYGVPIEQYLPRARYHLKDVIYGREFVTKLFPQMQFDIGIAPLKQTIFAEGKSNIKWQEYTRMGAAFVGSDVGPYKKLKHGVTVENTEEAWYKALKELIDNAKQRRQMVQAAQTELYDNWRLEDEKNWTKYKAMFEEVHNDAR